MNIEDVVVACLGVGSHVGVLERCYLRCKFLLMDEQMCLTCSGVDFIIEWTM
jgi:hypothetical protein